MYSRFIIWQSDPSLAVIGEVNFVNEFTVLNEAIDIRFTLKGYGYKPNFLDENVDVYNFGSYRCYYRKQGDVDWILFARAVSERANTEDAFVYADIHVSTGLIDLATYEIKIIAADADIFLSWGGTLEGIISGGTFWSELEARQVTPFKLTPTELISIAESVHLGMNPIQLFVVDDPDLPIRVKDIIPPSSPLMGWEIGTAGNLFESIARTEFILLSIISNISKQETFTVSEFVSFFSSLIQNHSPVDNVSSSEFFSAYLFPFYAFFFDAIILNEEATVGLTVMFLPTFFEDIPVSEEVDFDGLPPWRVRRGFDTLSVVDALPNIGNAPTDWLQRFGMFKYEQAHADPCDNFNSWAEAHTLNGTVQAVGGQFVFTSNAGICSVGNVFTLVQNGVVNRMWLFVEFDLYFDGSISGDQFFTVHFGDSVYVRIKYNHGTQSVQIDGYRSDGRLDNIFFNANLTTKRRFRYEILRPANHRIPHMADVYMDGTFLKRLRTDRDTSDTDRVDFMAPVANTICYLDNILMGILRGKVNSDIILFIIDSKEIFPDPAIILTESRTLAVVAKPPLEPYQVEPIIFITEVFTALLNPPFVYAPFDNVGVSEFAFAFISGGLIPIQEVTIGEFVGLLISIEFSLVQTTSISEFSSVERLEEGVFAQEYLATSENISIAPYFLVYDDDMSSILNITISGAFAQAVTITENITAVVV